MYEELHLLISCSDISSLVMIVEACITYLLLYYPMYLLPVGTRGRGGDRGLGGSRSIHLQVHGQIWLYAVSYERRGA